MGLESCGEFTLIDVAVLRGSAIRNRKGTPGRIESVSLPWVKLSWEVAGRPGGRGESFLRSDPKLMDEIEILTLDRGWVPLGEVVGPTREDGPRGPNDTLIVELRGILDERSKHYPFKRKGVLGPTQAHKSGPPPTGTRRVRKRGKWNCKCKDYVCKCSGPSGGKKIRIKRDYKISYNHAYRKWRGTE